MRKRVLVWASVAAALLVAAVAAAAATAGSGDHPGEAARDSKPEILVYEPTAGGGYRLVAADYFKPDADQDLRRRSERNAPRRR